jgi:hypothetical protein
MPHALKTKSIYTISVVVVVVSEGIGEGIAQKILNGGILKDATVFL